MARRATSFNPRALKMLRAFQGVSLEGLAALLKDAGDPISVPSLWRYENGRAEPPAERAALIEELLGAPQGSLSREPDLRWRRRR